MRIFFHCVSCDTFSNPPTGFNESKHFVKCSCGLIMYSTTGDPHDLRIDKEVQGTLIKINWDKV